jgi:transcriptional regulator with XRE-family HTH domain
MDIRKLFGANVRRYRIAAGLGQEAVAVRMGVDRAYVSAMERGVQNATLLLIWQTAQALGVRPVDLFDERQIRSLSDSSES